MECPPRPPSPGGSKVQEEAATPSQDSATPSTPVLVTPDGHLVFPLPLVQGLDAPTITTTTTFTPIPTTTTPPRPTTPRPTTPRRPTPRRPAPQPPTRPAPPTTPLPQAPDRPATPTTTRSTTPSDRSLSTTPVPELSLTATPTPTPQGLGLDVGGLSLRLIDDETDTDEDGRCDSFEERLVFPPRPVLTPARLTLTRPAPLRPQPPQLPPQTRPPEAHWWGADVRAPRGLAHSASDPGVRRPQMWVPSSAPLHKVPEEEGEGNAAPRLVRSDSVVTVPEDLLAPRPSLAGVAAAALLGAALMPGTAMLLHAAFRLVFGTLFPAYYSYKAVKTKNVKEYVKWMMYWIVFAFFTCLETITDIFLSFWFPFYYELKILVVLWLLSPATRGSSILYRKFVHPWLTRREEDIDNCIAQAKEQGYSAVLSLGSKGVNYATTVIMQTAIKGGGGLMNQLKRSYSSGQLMGDDGDLNRNIKPLPPHLQDQGYNDPHHHRAAPPGTPQTPHYLPDTSPSPLHPSGTSPSPLHPSGTSPSPCYTSPHSAFSPHFTPDVPPSPLLAGVDLDGPPSPPLTRQRLRQQQQQQHWQWAEEEREVDYSGY